jgi:hypothetical protein
MESNEIKVLFVKQQHDFNGPWASYQYEDGIESTILAAFRGKTSLYELLLFFKADVLLTPTKYGSPWLTPFLQNKQYTDYVSSVTTAYDITQIDLSKYNVIISHDPILKDYIPHIKENYPHIVTAYILAEHTSWQMHQLGLGYDLFLDHTFNMVDEVTRLPQAVNFSFPRTPETLRQLFETDSRNEVYYDYRSINYFVVTELLKDDNLDRDGYTATQAEVDSFYNIVQDYGVSTIRISAKTQVPFMLDLSNPHECIEYYQTLGKVRYFISIANRVGQAAVDAASLGCIVFGNYQSRIHRELCHPYTLMEDFTHTDLISKLRELQNDTSLQQEVLDYQNKQLDKHFIQQPMDTIKAAIRLKNK